MYERKIPRLVVLPTCIEAPFLSDLSVALPTSADRIPAARCRREASRTPARPEQRALAVAECRPLAVLVGERSTKPEECSPKMVPVQTTAQVQVKRQVEAIGLPRLARAGPVRDKSSHRPHD